MELLTPRSRYSPLGRHGVRQRSDAGLSPLDGRHPYFFFKVESKSRKDKVCRRSGGGGMVSSSGRPQTQYLRLRGSEEFAEMDNFVIDCLGASQRRQLLQTMGNIR